ncbi:ATP-binding cassette domain-containing protein [Salisediminibacterium halotolerans]|uniref:ABC-2 type transport system ATP-binding protein n=1 Tax=Salisediminibacterium halotolerans TaxID=517425 RepID=A0A1H9SWG9_9BACI|nr:ABC-2 type transport system ATP-binding protein [Salisediminibacterium haloalkalitolerans]
MMTMSVELQKVSYQIKQKDILADISLELKPGVTYGLLGRNGAGKTTLLSLIASYMKPTQGKVRIDGEDPFENERTFPHVCFMYGGDYAEESEPVSVYFDAAARYRPNFDRAYAEELAKRFELPLDVPINRLSSGMQSAMEAVIGLAAQAPVTLLDEIYTGMDAPNRKKFYEAVIEDQADNPRIIVLSTHLVSEMDYLFDHVFVLHKGQMLADDPSDTFISKGVTLTGDADTVDAFISERDVLQTKTLGNTKQALVAGPLKDGDEEAAKKSGLEIGTVTMQDLFIHLTSKEGEDNA